MPARLDPSGTFSRTFKWRNKQDPFLITADSIAGAFDGEDKYNMAKQPRAATTTPPLLSTHRSAPIPTSQLEYQQHTLNTQHAARLSGCGQSAEAMPALVAPAQHDELSDAVVNIPFELLDEVEPSPSDTVQTSAFQNVLQRREQVPQPVYDSGEEKVDIDAYDSAASGYTSTGSLSQPDAAIAMAMMTDSAQRSNSDTSLGPMPLTRQPSAGAIVVAPFAVPATVGKPARDVRMQTESNTNVDIASTNQMSSQATVALVQTRHRQQAGADAAVQVSPALSAATRPAVESPTAIRIIRSKRRKRANKTAVTALQHQIRQLTTQIQDMAGSVSAISSDITQMADDASTSTTQDTTPVIKPTQQQQHQDKRQLYLIRARSDSIDDSVDTSMRAAKPAVVPMTAMAPVVPPVPAEPAQLAASSFISMLTKSITVSALQAIARITRSTASSPPPQPSHPEPLTPSRPPSRRTHSRPTPAASPSPQPSRTQRDYNKQSSSASLAHARQDGVDHAAVLVRDTAGALIKLPPLAKPIIEGVLPIAFAKQDDGRVIGYAPLSAVTKLGRPHGNGRLDTNIAGQHADPLVAAVIYQDAAPHPPSASVIYDEAASQQHARVRRQKPRKLVKARAQRRHTADTMNSACSDGVASIQQSELSDEFEC